MKKRQSKYTKICFTSALNLLSVTLSIYNKSVTDSDIIAFLNNAETFLYFQTLHLSKESLLEFSTGHVIDLVSNDVQRLEEDTFIRFFLCPICVSSDRVDNTSSRLFYWLAGSNGSHISVFTSPIFYRIVLCWCCTAPAHSSDFRPSPLLDESDCNWDPLHQNTCMGR